MSLALERVNPITVHDPRIIQSDRTFPVLKGGEQVLYKVYTTTNISSSSVTFHCPPPSSNVYVDRRIHLRLPVRLSIAVTTANLMADGKYLIANGCFAIRSFPLQKAMETVQMVINNQAMSVNIGDIISCLEHFNVSMKLRAIDYSKCATYPIDGCQQFGDVNGLLKSPLLPATAVADLNVPRGAPFAVVTGGATQTASNDSPLTVIDFVSCEPLFLSPLYWGESSLNNSAFYGVKTMDFTFNFVSNAGNRMISIDPTTLFTAGDADTTRASSLSASVSFGPFAGVSPAFTYSAESTPALLFQYITPQLVDRGNAMQQVLNYPYSNIERYPTDYSAPAVSALGVAGAAVTMNSTNVQLSSIPTKIYVFARANNTQMQLNPYTPDSFMRLESFNMQWGNRSGLLAQASRQQLYDISVRAGCTQSYADWAGIAQQRGATPASYVSTVPTGVVGVAQTYFGTGTLLAIDPVDLGLDSVDAPGKLDQITLQINGTWSNLGQYAMNGCTLYVVCVSAGVFTLFNGQASSLIGILNSNDILNSHAQSGAQMLNYFDTKQIYGGGFLSDLASNLRHLKVKKAKCAGGAVDGGRAIARGSLRDRLQ